MEKTAAERHLTSRTVRAPRGPERTCRGWGQEAALRMLMNSLDPEVTESPAEKAVPAGESAVKDWPAFDAIARSLREMENDETLLVQSGKPMGIFRTQQHLPRVLIASAGMAGSWTHIGSQEILAETYAIFAAAARRHFAGNMAGKLIVTGGMGRMGGAQSLAATMNGAAILSVEVDPERIKRWVKAGYCDVMVNSLDEALRILKNAVRKKEAASVGLVANSADVVPELARRGVVPDLLTDQTPARDPSNGYVPKGLPRDAAAQLRRGEPEEYRKRALESIARHASGMLALARLGSAVFEFGNGMRETASAAGVKEASDFPDVFTAYLVPLFCEGRGPMRWIALSGEPEDSYRIDRLALEMFGEDESLARWIRLVAKRVRFQGLPARAGWLRYGEPERLGVAINDLVGRRELKAPIVIACNDFDSEFAASGNAEATSDESDAVADWPQMNALLRAANGATWVTFQIDHAAGAVWPRHAAELAVVADGTREMGTQIERALANTSESGIARLAEAGYAAAADFARAHGIRIRAQASGDS